MPSLVAFFVVAHNQYPHQLPANNGTSQSYPGHPSYYRQFSQPLPPPPELRPVVDKTAEYVAKNSDDFERTVLERHIGDARFSFLNPWDQYHAYYQAMKHYNRTIISQGYVPILPVEETAQNEEITSKPNVQKLSSSGTISFKLQPKLPPSSVAMSGPCSEFHTENMEEEEGEGEEVLEEDADDNEEGHPPAKRQRVENGEEEGDDIGRTVEVR